MIEFLFFFCLPIASGEFDCSYKVFMADVDEVNNLWHTLGKKGSVAGFYSQAIKSIYLSDMNDLHHEFLHAACINYATINLGENHPYCEDKPHFKVQ